MVLENIYRVINGLPAHSEISLAFALVPIPSAPEHACNVRQSVACRPRLWSTFVSAAAALACSAHVLTADAAVRGDARPAVPEYRIGWGGYRCAAPRAGARAVCRISVPLQHNRAPAAGA